MKKLIVVLLPLLAAAQAAYDAAAAKLNSASPIQASLELYKRVRELRDAFNATVKDPAFLADAQKMRLHLDPVSGEDVLKALTAAYAVPAEIVEIARETMGEK